ncbi:MAG TPA: hypothetical protein H9768_01285 [Candidatus Mailhella merdavium]|nr:hypothetical protein [Candidatus Mailhella merdavium]
MALPLFLSPALRAWARLGLETLLVDSSQRAGELRLPAEARGDRADMTKSSGPTQQKTARKLPSPSAGTLASASGQTSVPRPAPTRRKTAQAAETVRPAPSRPENDLHILPPEAWPPAWQALRSRRPLPPRPLVCWTYAGLGPDLTGNPDPQRKELVARMIRGLAHPGGTHVFWPFDLPGEALLSEDMQATLFWSGEALLHTRALLVMGSDARDALKLPKIGPYCQTMVRGRLFIQLPQPHSLAEKPDAFSQAMAFLSGLLRFCNTPRR